MSHTKVDLISGAYSKLRISGLTVDPTPEDLELALTRLENMMSEFEGARNIALGYNFEDDPDPNSVSNIPRYSYDGIESNLAIRLVPDFNKEVAMILYSQASGSISAISGRVARDRMKQVPYPSRMPVGSGNWRYSRWYRFYHRGAVAPNDAATVYMITGDITDISESFESWLADGEALSSFATTVSSRLTLNSSAINGDSIDLNVTANSASELETITIVVTSDAGRIITRVINFNITDPAQVS